MAALYAAFMDKNSERPPQTYEINLAPLPQNMPDECPQNNPCLSNTRQRPDLGDFEGPLYRETGYDATVAGVLSFSGAVFDFSIFE